VRLVVNGESQEVEAASLEGTLIALEYENATVATALNGAFVPARARAATPVMEGDRIEIVAPRQGG
jgi:sulfur carrier protein